jgi:hypothetical protein
MKTLRHLLSLSAALAGTALIAQDAPPPPTVTAAPPPAAPAPEIPVDGLIHVQQLPTTAQLTRDAEAEGMAITRMEQKEDRIIVTYRYASGNTRTFAYTTTLPEDPDTEVGAPPPARPAPVPAPNYTVIYTEPAPVYYPRYVRPYDPYYWPSSSFSLGIGIGRNWGSYGHPGYYGRPRYYGHRPGPRGRW